VASTAIGRVLFQIAGRTWSAIEHRTFAFTPTGGQAQSVETLAVRAYPDGTTPVDALLFDLTNGTGDLRAGAVTMASATMVDLGSAPAKKVAITGSATINSFGPGRHLERLVHFVTGGNILVHNATSLDLQGAANIVTRAGDRLLATSDGAGNWRVILYARADGSLVGFMPVQQGTGTGQLPNIIKIGWSATGLRADVGNETLGLLWNDNVSGRLLLANGYQKLPSGLILQWGAHPGAVQDPTISFPVAFPSLCAAVLPAATFAAGPTDIVHAYPTDITPTSFKARQRYVLNGGAVASATYPFNWIAVGY
jgi:hypothetical protein